MWIDLLTRLFDVISPRTCAVCGQRLSPTEEHVCTGCVLRLPRTNFHLNAYDNPLVKLFYGQFPIEKAASLFHYRPHADTSRLIYALKYFSYPELGVAMGRVMAEELLPTGFFDDMEAIIYVPLARKRERHRGYNQSERIAEGISGVTGLPIVSDTVRRVRFTQSQTTLTVNQRRDNVEDAFRVGRKASALKGKHVLLVDDIVTTGATVCACARTLADVEGIRISVLSLGFTS